MSSPKPDDIIAEVLGEPAITMRNPANADYACPFTNLRCTKRSHLIQDPLPVCSLYKARKNKAPDIVCVCPNRLYGADIFNDILLHCWPQGNSPKNLRKAFEVQMADFGRIDSVLASVNDAGEVEHFVSVELQTVDITGSYADAYFALLQNEDIKTKVTYNFNWKNVYKRYIMQLIFKGFAHHQWKTKIVAVMQDILVEKLWELGNFVEVDIKDANIVFMAYSMVEDPDQPGKYNLVFNRRYPTRHMDLMQGILYRNAPSRDEFVKKIKERFV